MITDLLNLLRWFRGGLFWFAILIFPSYTVLAIETDLAAQQNFTDFIYVLQVLVIGGGDGGVIREVVKHPKVKEVVLCEIDQVRLHINDGKQPTSSLLYLPYLLLPSNHYLQTPISAVSPPLTQ